MAFDWRIQVIGEDGSSKPTVTSSDAVAAIENFEVFPGGDCGELNMTADPTQVDIAARDIITVEFTRDGSAWLPMYRGVVVVAGNARQDGLQAYRAVGLKQRLYEVAAQTAKNDGADVTLMAMQLLDHASLPVSRIPYGINYTIGTPPGPLTGFQLGDRLILIETLGEAFDILTSSVGPFIVPPGPPYVYDGKSYPEGDMVPGVVWGVDATGAIIWRRAQHPTLAFDERDRRTTVDWQAVTAEEHANRVELVYGTGYDPAAVVRTGPAHSDPFRLLPPVPLAIRRQFPLVTDERRYADRQVFLDHPLDYMRPESGLAWLGLTTWTDPGNALDGDPATYAVSGFAGSTGVLLIPNNEVQGILEVRYRPVPGPLRIFASFGNMAVTFEVMTTLDLRLATEDDELDFDYTRYFLISPPAAELFNTTEVRLSFSAGGTGTRLYEIRYWVPDLNTGQRVSQAFAWPIRTEVASVTYAGWGDITQSATVIPAAGGAPIELEVERISYALDPDQGLLTTYWAGGTYEPELLSQRIVLERLASRVSADRTQQPQTLRRQTW